MGLTTLLSPGLTVVLNEPRTTARGKAAEIDEESGSLDELQRARIDDIGPVNLLLRIPDQHDQRPAGGGRIGELADGFQGTIFPQCQMELPGRAGIQSVMNEDLSLTVPCSSQSPLSFLDARMTSCSSARLEMQMNRTWDFFSFGLASGCWPEARHLRIRKEGPRESVTAVMIDDGTCEDGNWMSFHSIAPNTGRSRTLRPSVLSGSRNSMLRELGLAETYRSWHVTVFPSPST